MENILSVKQIKKSFGGVHALKGVDLTIKKGETHCLAGENGCGKSTIIKVISGFYKPDGGSIEVDGKAYPVMTPAEAIKAGIQVIYQDFSIFPNLTVIENLAFNQVLANKKKFVNKKEFRRIAEEAVAKINFDVDLDALVETLPVADKQLIAISRALLDNAKLIIMDEPTTALTKKEVKRLFEIIAQLKENGVTILFVSHKLDEVFEISDSITIMRNGENVISCPTSEMTEEKFAYYMTGRHFEDKQDDTGEKKIGKTVLEVDKLSAPGFENISFDLHEGEILGITGQLGSGRTELSLALSGMLKPTEGTIKLEGKDVKFKSVTQAQKMGISLVPEDRLTEGLFLPQSIVDNITVTRLDDIATAGGIVNKDKVLKESADWVKDLGVATKDHTFPVATLSGGNQQKVVVAKALSQEMKVVIMDEPTKGVDVGAKAEIYAIMGDLAKKGYAIILISSEMPEILGMADRIVVMCNGRKTGELNRGEATQERILELAMEKGHTGGAE